MSAGEVAEVRVGMPKVVVLDFGLLRTVSGVRFEGGAKVFGVRAWNGAGFAEAKLNSGNPEIAVAFAEVRTERLEVTLDGAVTEAMAADGLFVILPGSAGRPRAADRRRSAGLTFPGPVRPETEGWDAQGQRIVALAAAVAPLAGIPASPGEDPGIVAFQLILSSRVPGILDLGLAESAASRIGRAGLAGEGSRSSTSRAKGLSKRRSAEPAGSPRPGAGSRR